MPYCTWCSELETKALFRGYQLETRELLCRARFTAVLHYKFSTGNRSKTWRLSTGDSGTIRWDPCGSCAVTDETDWESGERVESPPRKTLNNGFLSVGMRKGDCRFRGEIQLGNLFASFLVITTITDCSRAQCRRYPANVVTIAKIKTSATKKRALPERWLRAALTIATRAPEQHYAMADIGSRHSWSHAREIGAICKASRLVHNIH